MPAKKQAEDKADWEKLSKGKLAEITRKWHNDSGFTQREMEALVGIHAPGAKRAAKVKLEEIRRIQERFVKGITANV